MGGLADSQAEARQPASPSPTLPHALSGTITTGLGLCWSECLRVARGEVALAEARPKHVRRRTEGGGPDDLVSLAGIRLLFALTPEQAEYLANRSGFPVPVLVVGANRMWIRSDVVAFKEGRPFPAREENELRERYYVASEVAALLGIAEKTLRAATTRKPPMTAKVARRALWLKKDVECWLAEEEGRRKQERAWRPRSRK